MQGSLARKCRLTFTEGFVESPEGKSAAPYIYIHVLNFSSRFSSPFQKARPPCPDGSLQLHGNFASFLTTVTPFLGVPCSAVLHTLCIPSATRCFAKKKTKVEECKHGNSICAASTVNRGRSSCRAQIIQEDRSSKDGGHQNRNHSRGNPSTCSLVLAGRRSFTFTLVAHGHQSDAAV